MTFVRTGLGSDIVIHANRFMEVTARSVNLGGHTGAPYFRPLDAPFEAARIQVLGNIFYRSGDVAIAQPARPWLRPRSGISNIVQTRAWQIGRPPT